jgi:hypothetical protein
LRKLTILNIGQYLYGLLITIFKNRPDTFRQNFRLRLRLKFDRKGGDRLKRLKIEKIEKKKKFDRPTRFYRLRLRLRLRIGGICAM